MVDQYPDSVVFTVNPAMSQDPNTGVYSAATGDSTVNTFECRAELNSKGFKVPGKDGAMVEYAFILFLPTMTYNIPFDADYALTVRGIAYTGKVKGVSRGQLNARVWV